MARVVGAVVEYLRMGEAGYEKQNATQDCGHERSMHRLGARLGKCRAARADCRSAPMCRYCHENLLAAPSAAVFEFALGQVSWLAGRS
jgi:hypothetical protein